LAEIPVPSLLRLTHNRHKNLAYWPITSKSQHHALGGLGKNAGCNVHSGGGIAINGVGKPGRI